MPISRRMSASGATEVDPMDPRDRPDDSGRFDGADVPESEPADAHRGADAAAVGGRRSGSHRSDVDREDAGETSAEQVKAEPTKANRSKANRSNGDRSNGERSNSERVENARTGGERTEPGDAERANAESTNAGSAKREQTESGPNRTKAESAKAAGSDRAESGEGDRAVARRENGKRGATGRGKSWWLVAWDTVRASWSWLWRWPGIGRGVLASVLAVALVALVVLAGFLGWQVKVNADVAARKQAIVTDARSAAQNLLSFSAKTIDADQKRVLARATGDFRDEYSRGAPQLKTGIVQAKASATATILAAGISVSDADSATVLVVADVTTRSAQVPKGVVRHVRIQQQMAYESGSWRLAQLQFVG